MDLDSIQYKPHPAEDFPSWSGKPLSQKLNSAEAYRSLWNTDFKELSLSDDEPSLNSLAVPARSQKGAHTNDRVNQDHCQSPREGQGCVDTALLDPNELQMQVDFFRKLGYSSDEIRAVLQKRGLNADTNTVLGELVRFGATASEREMVPTTPPGPTVVSREENYPAVPGTPPPSQEDERDEGSLLRPVVIDGSNVAMRYSISRSIFLKKKKKKKKV
ncbi:probable ribonuclease ZC3H12C [Polyodon spathula]|uniref:probable ribonuclease ZC3H12C n=1 Tax=Polyodon spathula TaxID=7913 RepID=UPI001B7EAA5F|nr:probable ribonuclease ZC3H12C [Polyodon spathula]